MNPVTGKLGLRVIDPSLNAPLTMNLDLLVLAGGMAPAQGTPDVAQVLNLPQNSYGFYESHYQCHPEECQRTGIYIAGCAREPMRVSQSIESAHLAAMKALKYLEGRVLIEPTYPVVDKTRCDQCKRCMEECSFGSFTFDEKNFRHRIWPAAANAATAWACAPWGSFPCSITPSSRWRPRWKPSTSLLWEIKSR